MSSNSIRQRVIDKFRATLGTPETMHVRVGDLYRWTLSRGVYQITMYVTVDSPEHEDLAHIMISDSTRFQERPIMSHIVYSIEEAEHVLQRILDQWKLEARPTERDLQLHRTS